MMNEMQNAIAVIGMSGRFPGANTVSEFWRNLEQGVESIRFFEREQEHDIDNASWNNPQFVNAGAVLDNIDHFDAGLFGYSGTEAELMDPQQRVFMQCAWEALEDAGYNWQSYPGLIGVYAGAGNSQYFRNNLHAYHQQAQSNDPVKSMLMELANENDYLATRVSYKLNLSGPSLNVQTACSTSLVAVHMAIQALLSGDTDIALAGGVHIKVPHRTGYLYRDEFVQSKDGHCYAFDERASGTVFGNGAAIVVLKLLEDAIEDRDNIHAVIRGSAINNDGAQKAGFVAPSAIGQQQVIEEALSIANVNPTSIGYVETHGTGTLLGDPIEIGALSAAYSSAAGGTAFAEKCAIGSVKTNIGHLEEAAGVTSLIKVCMALKHQKIPASLNFETPNPRIDFDNSPFYVNTQLIPWKSNDIPRRAGISSFGIGGTNAHVIVEEFINKK
ncbi:polyketide synthase [Alteromonas sp. a30]|nr:polyketide synthase [Alteromonas sp. a30]